MEMGARPPMIWLHFQECMGCTESLLRTSHPGLADVLFDPVSLDYYETQMAALRAERQNDNSLELSEHCRLTS